MKVIEIIELKRALDYELSYDSGKALKLKDIEDFKFQYAFDKNKEILDREVNHINKALKIDEILNSYKKRYAEEIKNVEDETAKLAIGKDLDFKFSLEAQELYNNAPDVEIKLYMINQEIPNDLKVSRSSFWVLKHFIPEEIQN